MKKQDIRMGGVAVFVLALAAATAFLPKIGKEREKPLLKNLSTKKEGIYEIGKHRFFDFDKDGKVDGIAYAGENVCRVISPEYRTNYSHRVKKDYTRDMDSKSGEMATRLLVKSRPTHSRFLFE